jgi:plastocyanin
MLRHCAAPLIAPAIVLGLLSAALAEKTVTVVDDVNLPASIELAVGEYVTFLNGAGGTAHIVVGDNDAVEFYVAERGSRMRFTKPGTYRYTVHVIGRRPHTHTGTVVVR